MLKNPKLLKILGSPDNPDGDPLIINGDHLDGAGWPVPISGGIPDFVTHAPRVRRSLSFEIPIEARPEPELLTCPLIPPTVPRWFTEEHGKYPLLLAHRKGFLLDAGSGQGNRMIFEKLGYDYIALDISFNSQQRSLGPADVDVVADSHRLPLQSSSVEAVNSTAVLEHLYCPPLAIREIHRVLKPGGLLVGSCSFLEGEHFDSQYHVTHLGLYRWLVLNGMKVLHIYPGTSLWELHSGSIYFSLPGNEILGRLHRRLYLLLTDILGSESAKTRLLRHAAVLNFMAVKPETP
jgi:SAM-dependent methyltransferase